MQLVVAPDVQRTNEDLWHSHLSASTLNHFITPVPVATDIDLTIVYALPIQQSLGGIAKGAIAGCVDLDRRHDVPMRWLSVLYGTACGRYNPRKNQHIDMRSACPQQRAGTGVNGCAGSQDVIDQYQAASH